MSELGADDVDFEMNVDQYVEISGALPNKEVIERIKDANAHAKSPKERMKVTGNTGELKDGYREYIEKEVPSGSSALRQPAILYTVEDGETGRAALTESPILPKSIKQPGVYLSAATRKCLELLDSPVLHTCLHKSKDDDLSDQLTPLLHFVDVFLSAQNELSQILLHNFAETFEKRRPGIKEAIPSLAAPAVFKDFFATFGGVESKASSTTDSEAEEAQDITLSEMLSITNCEVEQGAVGKENAEMSSDNNESSVGDPMVEVLKEIDVVQNAVFYEALKWACSFYNPPPDCTSYPIDFNDEEKKSYPQEVHAGMDRSEPAHIRRGRT